MQFHTITPEKEPGRTYFAPEKEKNRKKVATIKIFAVILRADEKKELRLYITKYKITKQNITELNITELINCRCESTARTKD